MGRKTKFVRVKLQFILEYDQEFDGIPSGNIVEGVCHAAAKYMANDAAKRENGPQTVAWHGGRQEVGLYFPKRPPPPKAKPKKRAR